MANGKGRAIPVDAIRYPCTRWRTTNHVPIPDYETVMLPLLNALSDGGVHYVKDLRERLAQEFKLTPAELAERLPSGDTIFRNRFGWATTSLKKAGLIEPVVRGQYRITSRGSEVLKSKPLKIDSALLKQFPDFLDFVNSKREALPEQESMPAVAEEPEKRTPQEVLDNAYQQIRRELADELLQTVRAAPPAFFENLVVDLLVKIGYGGSRKDAGKAVGRTGDDGVDGIIKEDRLGLDAVYIQAKRWTAVVGRPDVQAFAGSLEGNRARKGVFITTSDFSRDAREYVTRIEKKIVLINGEELAQLMMDSGVGVADVGVYQVKKLDRDYFEE
jgi:restriction system protein